MNGLIEKAQKGDTRAFEKLVKKYDRQILSLAYQISGNTQDAEDIYQEVFMRAFKSITSFNQKSSFFTWLYRIAVNCSLTYCNRRKSKAHMPLEDEENDFSWQPVDDLPTPDKTVLNQELKEKIKRGVNTLSPMQKTTFILRFYHQLKIREIAQVTDKAEGTIKNYLFRATRNMQKKLSPYVESEVI
ncbi:MAG: sigma-70 family RNA polymerase sigma factor [bacterium]